MQSKFLSNKKALLSSPGTVYNDLYYSITNSTTSLVETTYETCVNVRSLTSTQFGSSSSVNLQNENFVNEVYLFAELPNLVANQTLSRGWLYSAIREVEYVIGASSSSFTIQGESLFALAMGQCHTEEERSELIQLAGHEYLAPVTAPAGKDAPRITGQILIPLPWSSHCYDRLGLPSDLLSSNIVITIRFNDSSAIFGGTGARPDSFTKLELQTREGVLTDKSKSLKYQMLKDPSLIYNYPFIHCRQFSQVFTGYRESENVKSQVNLQGFIQSDLLGIIVQVIKNSDLSSTSSNAPNALNLDDITNVELTYNGIPIYRANYDAWKLYNMHGIHGSSGYGYSVIAPGTTAPFNSSPTSCHLLFIDFSRIRSACLPDRMFNTFRVANQTLNLTFNTSQSDSYTCFCTYLYNGIISLQSGVSQVYFD